MKPKCLLSEDFDMHTWWDGVKPLINPPPDYGIRRHNCLDCLCSYYAKSDNCCGFKGCRYCGSNKWSHNSHIFEGNDEDIIKQRFSESKKRREDSLKTVQPVFNLDFGIKSKKLKKRNSNG